MSTGLKELIDCYEKDAHHTHIQCLAVGCNNFALSSLVLLFGKPFITFVSSNSLFVCRTDAEEDKYKVLHSPPLCFCFKRLFEHNYVL